MNYWLQFGASTISGLNPTFIQWRTTGGGSLAPPSISEPGSGGAYMFAYNALTQIFFVADGATSALSFNDRYVSGVVDPSDNFGFTLSGIASTQVAAQSFAVQGFSLAVQNFSLSVQGYSLGVQNFSLANLNYSLGVNSFSLLIANASLLGTTASSYGTQVSDPATVFGFLKRAQETREGNETYTKATGILDSYARGTSTILIEKTISDSSTETTKT